MITGPGEVYRRLVRLVFRDRFIAEMEEEMRLHRELRAERLQRGGLAPAAARDAARRRFGNTIHIQERSIDMWGMEWTEQIGADLRFAVRRLRRRPGFSLATITVAALGIGATTAVFSAVDAAILRPLPFLRADELVTLSNVRIPYDPGAENRFPSGPHAQDVHDVAGMRGVFSSVAAFAAGGLNLEEGDQPRRVKVGVVTSTFFPTLGVRPARGRTFSEDEGKPGTGKTVILSDALWRNHFGGANMLGQSVTLHGKRYQVIGIMPRDFSFPTESDLWIPLTVPTTSETFAPFRGYLPSRVIARLAPGVPVEAAGRQLLARWEHSLPPVVDGKRSGLHDVVDEVRAEGAVIPLQQNIVGNRRNAFLILMGATLLLLLIAAANIANLLLSDGAARRREVALREVIGASRGRVIRLLLCEAVVLSVSGAIIGLALAPAALGLLRNLVPPDLIGTAAIRIDLRVLGFATAIAVTTGLLFGMWPALGTARVDPAEVIKSGGGHGSTAGRMGLARRTLVTAELALTVMLLVGSGLMLRSFHRMMTQDLGMQPGQAGTLEMTFARSPAEANATSAEVVAARARRIEQMISRLEQDPRIAHVGAVNDLPLRGGGGIGISVEPEGLKAPDGAFARYLIANGEYFKAMGIPLLRGRTFLPTDDTVGARAAIINSAMAREVWGDVDPLGRRFTFGGDSTFYTVVGIVANVRENDLTSDPGPQMYFSIHERVPSNLALIARSSLPPAELLGRMTAAVREAAPTQAVFNVRMMEQVLGKSVAPKRTNTLLITIFGGLALVLSAFGVYAVVSYGVTQRAREFGIRAALGASSSDIVGLVTKEMLAVVLAGLGLGLALAWVLSRVLSSMIYGIGARDATTFIAVPAVLLIPVLIATLVPAMRAMRVNPVDVIRAE